MASQFGLTELLSRLLVAFTVEFDGVAEQRIEHRRGNKDSVWLASQAMWANFLQFVPAAGVPLNRLASLVPIINLPGLRRWRYVRLEPDPAGRRPAPDTLVQAVITPFGPSGPSAGHAWTDTTAVAAGGFSFLLGDADRPPVRMLPPASRL